MVIYAGSTATLAAIQDRVELHSIITVAPGDGTAADQPGPPVDAHLHTTTSFARALAEGATLPFAPPVLEGGDRLFLQYTGGTTGLSKGAMLTHRNLVANVEAAMRRHGVKHPVAQDNRYGTWKAYSNQYWPATYLIDAQGRIRYKHFGEGEYERTEGVIRTLLTARG